MLETIIWNFTFKTVMRTLSMLYFQAILLDKDNRPLGGSIAGGGRYDHLIGMFSHKEIPAVGVSIGIERLLAIVQDKNSKEDKKLNDCSRKLRKNHTQVSHKYKC